MIQYNYKRERKVIRIEVTAGRDSKAFIQKGYKVTAIDGSNELQLIEVEITSDVRSGREDEKWLNFIIKKQ